MAEPRAPFLPGAVAIEAYGAGRFRFAGMSHRGGLLCLPSGMHGWDAAGPADLTAEKLAPLAAEAADIDICLIGTGASLLQVDARLLMGLRLVGLRPQVMTTGAALRIYNICLSEARRGAAALLPVE
jgi:uncharacterized protein